MQENRTPTVNSWLEDELYQQYRHDRQAVDPGWDQVFRKQRDHQRNPARAHGRRRARPRRAPALAPGDELVLLRGPALRIAENMTASLTIPVATSQRVMPVKVLEENRRLINRITRQAISYTHLIAWAIVKALEKVPA